MAIGWIAGILAGGFGLGLSIPPAQRAMAYRLNAAFPNEILAPAETIAALRRKLIDFPTSVADLQKHGYDFDTQTNLYHLSRELLRLTELITLYRRGQFENIEVLYEKATQVGWTSEDVDYMLKVTEVIPTAGDIIRYAVREVYTPEIAEAFGQYQELPEVLEKAATDIIAAGLPEPTFTKEWAAHWLLPSILQGFEMLHRGVIPFKSTADQPLSLERLMRALDIMPAWREPLKAISYSPYTRVDVRRMHKIGVLDNEAVFTAYADVGFSPFAPGCVHDTVAAAFACETCRHFSKAGHMLDFTILYNAEPPEVEKTEDDKERERTKSDILTGLADGLVDEGEAVELLTKLKYGAASIAYYLGRVDYERDKDELTTSLRYLHDSYLKGVITFAGVTDELGKLNLPTKMVEYYQRTWDLERLARSNKPTKSELMTFLRKGVIDDATWHAEMIGLGYPDRYIQWYAKAEEGVTKDG
ncbi:hypothetical protein ES703_25096 [subsurface metagenome]